jgi:hypothetical protein
VLPPFEHMSLVCGLTRSRTVWAYTDFDRGGTSKTDKNDPNDAAAICEAVGSVYSGENGHPVPRKRPAVPIQSEKAAFRFRRFQRLNAIENGGRAPCHGKR